MVVDDVLVVVLTGGLLVVVVPMTVVVVTRVVVTEITVVGVPPPVVVVVTAIVVVVPVVPVGHASPAARGLQIKTSESWSTRAGRSVDFATEYTLSRPALLPLLLVFTRTPVVGPQGSPALSRDRPGFTFHIPMVAAGQSLRGWLRHNARLNVQVPFGRPGESPSQVGSHSVHSNLPPSRRFGGVPSNSTRHSVVA